MNRIWHGVLDALGAAGSMTWQVTWSLILGFTLSVIVQALVKKSTIARLLTLRLSQPFELTHHRCPRNRPFASGAPLRLEPSDLTCRAAPHASSTKPLVRLGMKRRAIDTDPLD